MVVEPEEGDGASPLSRTRADMAAEGREGRAGFFLKLSQGGQNRSRLGNRLGRFSSSEAITVVERPF